MRTIERTSAFKKDFKRIRVTPKHRDLADKLGVVLQHLVADNPLPQKYLDHPLSGEWKDHREETMGQAYLLTLWCGVCL